MIRDYKYAGRRRQPAPRARIKWQWHGALLFLVGAVLAVTLVETEKSEASDAASNSENTKTVRVDTPKPSKQAKPAVVEDAQWSMESYELTLPPAPETEKTPSDNPEKTETDDTSWQTFVVKPGYNLAVICSRAGVKTGELHALMQMGEPVKVLERLYPNDRIRLKVRPDGTLGALEYEIDKTQRLRVTRVDGASEQPQFETRVIEQPLETRTAHATGVIDDSLFLTARRAGLSNRKAIELAGIFAWDIDFALEVRKGDRFTVVYEERYRDGEYVEDGPIIAAEFVNSGEAFRAVRYTTPEGATDYYTPEGKSVRKTFMRNPVEFTRISSRFDPNRKHPVLNKIRAHKGVDYAAPSGTPIRAAGDGKVHFRGRKGGYGNVIVIKHGQRYSTLYAHMSRYGRNTQRGRRVKQGQTIGYIGQSGLATGPHLHYEFRVDGVHRNPLTIKHPSVEPVPEKYRDDFLDKASPKLAQLDTLNRTRFALEDSAEQTPRI